MNKHIVKGMAWGALALMLGACNDSQSDLLEPKVYFENKEYTIQVEDESNAMDFNLTSRLTHKTEGTVQVTYTIADQQAVDAYNARYGTSYAMFDASRVKLSQSTANIESGALFAENVKLQLSDLNTLEEGKSFILPVRLSASPVMAEVGTDLAYFFITKPLKLKHAGQFGDGYISVKFPAGTYFESFTYEALVNVSYFNGNSTIMGTEGIMIFRIGDTGGGVAGNLLQAAGQQNYYTKDGLNTNTWYHVALTYDKVAGKSAIYVNGEKWAETGWAIAGFDPNADVGFKIGKLPGFPWGERPLVGKMCELRVWSVARTQNQLKQNMLTVDTKSDHLELYYKLDGSEEFKEGKLTDSTGKITAETGRLNVVELDKPIVIE